MDLIASKDMYNSHCPLKDFKVEDAIQKMLHVFHDRRVQQFLEDIIPENTPYNTLYASLYCMP